MHTALRVVAVGRTANSILPLPRFCPLAPLVTSCPSLLPTSVPGTQQQVHSFSQGGGPSHKSGKENEGRTVSEKSQTLDELRKEIEEIENKQWTIDELRTEIKKVANMSETIMIEKSRQLEDVRNQLAVKIYDFEPRKYVLSEEENKRLKKIYNLNAKALKIGVSNDELKIQLDFLKDVVKEHERRRQILNKEVLILQDLITGGVEAFCRFLEKNKNVKREKLLNVGKDPSDTERLEKELRHPNTKETNTEREIRHLKNELRSQKELLLKRIEHLNKAIMEKTELINKIKSCGDVLLRLNDKEEFQKAKQKVVSHFKNNVNEEGKIHKEMEQEKDKFRKVHTKLRSLKNKIEEFNILCENHRKEPK